MAVKDSGDSGTQGGGSSQYDLHTPHSTPISTSATSALQVSSSPSASSTLASTSPSAPTQASLGLATSSAAAATVPAAASHSKTSHSTPTTKTPQSLPPGVPLIPNYMPMGQPGMAGMAPFAFASLAAQQPMYSYEDLQLLQQRIQMPPTTLTSRDQSAVLGAYTATAADNKLSRVEAQSPVNAQTTTQQGTQSAHQQQQQQAFINPTALPPGYNYYYPSGVLPGGYSYTPTMFPMPSVTNTAHGGTTGSAQFQKQGGYSSHGYTAGQSQDYSKTYGAASQAQNKATSGTIVASSSASDLSATGSTYGKTHTQSFDKGGFHAGTPPPFNLPIPTGTQAGPMGAAPTAYGAPYVPVMAHQPHSQMIHHALQQDSTGGSGRSSQQSSSQSKQGMSKTYGSYWGN